jgi:hypothetical protein
MAERHTDNREQRLRLTGDELLLIKNALNEVLNGPDALEEWEFQTRMGCARDAAVTLLERLQQEGFNAPA